MTVREKVLRAFRQLIMRDRYLLLVEANEQSLTHRLAIYVEQEFPDYHVDCEFQKNKREPKILERFRNPEAGNSGLVYPDIIIHHRNTDDNHVVIEAKTSSTDSACGKSIACRCDRCKLWAYRNELGYRNAFYVILPIGEKATEFAYGQIENYLIEVTEDPAKPVAAPQ